MLGILRNGLNPMLSSVSFNYGIAERLGGRYNRKEWFKVREVAKGMECGSELTQEEFDCLVNKGFLSLLAMRNPELLDNGAFQFAAKGILAIEMLEEHFSGKTYGDFINYIDETVVSKGGADKELYEAIKTHYTESERKKYLECRELYESQSQSQQTTKKLENIDSGWDH